MVDNRARQRTRNHPLSTPFAGHRPGFSLLSLVGFDSETTLGASIAVIGSGRHHPVPVTER